MKTFSKYLQSKGYKISTINQHLENVETFTEWLETNSIAIGECRYKEIIDFIDNNKGINQRRINRTLTSITYYFDYLNEKRTRLFNPTKNIRVKAQQGRKREEPIQYEKMVEFYKNQESRGARGIRNHVILGLLLFQGMTTRELDNLTIENLHLREGYISLKGSSGSNLRKGTSARILPLNAVQIIDIIEYLKVIRPGILSGNYSDLPGRNPLKRCRRKANKLILSLKGSLSLKNTLRFLFIDMKKVFPTITSSRKIRECVIRHWLKKNNMRQVQYMSGHRFVSSTEWYKESNVEQLSREINMYHPLK
jgi:integrase/recombinase XerD